MVSLWITLIYHKDDYDLNGHQRSHKAQLAKFLLAHSFINRF